MTLKNSFIKVSCTIAVVLGLTGCAFMDGQSTVRNSSLVDFLYPGEKFPVAKEQMTQLSLPLKVGIAFTPSQYPGVNTLSEAAKSQLLENISSQFLQTNMVHSIEVIPSTYLRSGGSFQNLEQLKAMFAIDIIMLLSYDQTRFTSEGLASFSYWTILGAYVVPGEKNDTQTLIDAAVYDIASQKLLFRAPGTSVVNSRGTLVNNSVHLQEDSLNGFKLASEDLSQNLQVQLELFKEKVKTNPEQYQVTARPGYTGSGNLDGVEVILALLGLGIMSAMKDKRAATNA